MANGYERLIVALDLPQPAAARALVAALPPEVSWFKVGLELFTAGGPQGVLDLVAQGRQVFLDLKIHDIPRTAAACVGAAVGLGCGLLTLHTGGGREMLRLAAATAREEAARLGVTRPRLVGVTVLTSLDEAAAAEAGLRGPVADLVRRRAALAREAGLDGVVASPQEVALLRRELGRDFIIVTPGVRPTGSAAGDQRRTATPGEAVAAGADYLVVGRPITTATDPGAAAGAIARELATEPPGGGQVFSGQGL